MDTVGILSRDFDVVEKVSQHFYNWPHESSDLATLPLKLIYPSHLFPVEDKAAQAVYDRTVEALERIMQTERVVLDFRQEWTRAQNYTTESYEKYFESVGFPNLKRTWILSCFKGLL